MVSNMLNSYIYEIQILRRLPNGLEILNIMDWSTRKKLFLRSTLKLLTSLERMKKRLLERITTITAFLDAHFLMCLVTLFLSLGVLPTCLILNRFLQHHMLKWHTMQIMTFQGLQHPFLSMVIFWTIWSLGMCLILRSQKGLGSSRHSIVRICESGSTYPGMIQQDTIARIQMLPYGTLLGLNMTLQQTDYGMFLHDMLYN